MNTQTKSATPSIAIHKGPHPGMLADPLHGALLCRPVPGNVVL